MTTQAYHPTPPRILRKGMAITSLVLGIGSLLTFGCLGIGALVGLILGIVAVRKAATQPRWYGGRGIAIGGIVTNALGFVLLPIAGIIAAIAIPSLMRARISANESATIGDIRTVISGQMAYSTANDGFYEGRLECLATPADCIPGYSGPNFLDAQLASSAVKTGYKRELRGLVGRAGMRSGRASTTSVSAFAYIAVPEQPGNTGIRAFCGDSEGMLCATPDGRPPEIDVDGTCDLSSCQILR